ncbi:MAG TPA: nicotinamide riboside transporter PnuC [Chitinophagaceae bacterium]
MSLPEIFQQFVANIKSASLLEYIAVITGIASVWYSRKVNVLAYPVGLVNTIIYIYLSFKFHLAGEASVNFYYTVMSIYGWYIWLKKDKEKHPVIHVSYSNRIMLLYQFLFFLTIYFAYYISLVYLKKEFFKEAIPWGDALATATAFTGMWLMTRKKVESWYWWIATNIASIPLYFVKGLVLTSVYYLILLVFAFWGLSEWKRRARLHTA